MIRGVSWNGSGNKAPAFDQMSWAALRRGKAGSAFSEARALDEANRCFETGCSVMTAHGEGDAYLRPDSETRGGRRESGVHSELRTRG